MTREETVDCKILEVWSGTSGHAQIILQNDELAMSQEGIEL